MRGSLLTESGNRFPIERNDVYIGERGKQVVSFISDAPDEIEDDLKKAYESYQENPVDLVAIARFGLEYVSIHPFDNYNGRTKVLMKQMLFRRAGLRCILLLNLDEMLQKDRLRYFSALQRTSGIVKGLSPLCVEPYADYLFTILIQCYQERIQAVASPSSFDVTFGFSK